MTRRRTSTQVKVASVTERQRCENGEMEQRMQVGPAATLRAGGKDNHGWRRQ